VLDEEKVKRMVVSLKAMRKAVLLSLTVILTPATMIWFAYHHGKLASAAEKSEELRDFGFMHQMTRVTYAIIALVVVAMVGGVLLNPAFDMTNLLLGSAGSTIAGSAINLITWYVGRRFFRKRLEAHSSVLGMQACNGLIASCYVGIAGSAVGLLSSAVT
jgi:hypothetical protein